MTKNVSDKVGSDIEIIFIMYTYTFVSLQVIDDNFRLTLDVVISAVQHVQVSS